MKLRPIAMYLPQFHPIPENDEWWGKGFTEWTNVTRAKPLFDGHYQPHLPAGLGFYDLRLNESRIAQETLAKENGIYGFCYYHYWFNGKRILEKPLLGKLANQEEDLPFMLCWANENWTRVWDGGENNILLEQKYSGEDDIEHIRSLIPVFKDSRYIRVDNKSVFVVYKSTLIPDVKSTIKIWRDEAGKAGIELYLCRMDSFGDYGKSFLDDGFDAAIDFEPFSVKLDEFRKELLSRNIKNKLSFWYARYKLTTGNKRKKLVSDLLRKLDYPDYVRFVKEFPSYNYKCYPGITPMWDNSARKKDKYFMFKNSSPIEFKSWLIHEVEKFDPFGKEENFLFINAWNEWAEGNHLEPCQKWGNQYLDVVKEIFKKKNA